MTDVKMVADHTARAHSAVVGGSSAGRVLQCPGSVQLCAQYPNVETEFAAEGTALHMALDMIMSGLADKDTDVIGLTFNGYVITPAMYDEALRPILEKWDELDQELGGIEFLSEQRVAFPGIPNAFGTTDLIGAAKDRTIVADAKFGRGVAVSAEENPQEFYYARAGMASPATARFFHPDKPVEFIIFQPRVNDGEPFSRWMTTTKQLLAFEVELKAAVETAMQPDAPLKMGPYCRFCSAKVGCPLFQNRVEEVGLLSREQMEAELERWLPYADQMIAWGKAVKETAHKLLEEGGSVPGWKLVGGRRSRDWKDPDKTLRYLAKVGLPAAERHVKEIVSPAQAEAALKRNGLPAELPATLVEWSAGSSTLAPESDKRAALPVTAGAFTLLQQRLAGR